MWHHFVNLLAQSWNNVLASLSSSTLSIILFSLASPVLVFVITLRFVSKKHPEKRFVDHAKDSLWPTLIGVFVPLFLLFIVFTWKLVTTVYEDHRSLVAQIAKLKAAQAVGEQNPNLPHHGLKVTYGQKLLDGLTISVTTHYGTTDGKVVVGPEAFNLDAFRVKNVGESTTGTISATLYLSSNIQGWQSAPSDEPEFKYAFNMVGGFPARIDPQQTISLEPYYAMTSGPWRAGEIVSARLKVFYGADKPATANFRIRKTGLQN